MRYARILHGPPSIYSIADRHLPLCCTVIAPSPLTANYWKLIASPELAVTRKAQDLGLSKLYVQYVQP